MNRQVLTNLVSGIGKIHGRTLAASINQPTYVKLVKFEPKEE